MRGFDIEFNHIPTGGGGCFPFLPTSFFATVLLYEGCKLAVPADLAKKHALAKNGQNDSYNNNIMGYLTLPKYAKTIYIKAYFCKKTLS